MLVALDGQTDRTGRVVGSRRERDARDLAARQAAQQPQRRVLIFSLGRRIVEVVVHRETGPTRLHDHRVADVTLREWRGVDIDEAEAVTKSRVLFVFLLVSLAAVLALEVRGLARGGDFAQSLWQFRAILWLPIVTFLFSYCLRTPRDLVAVAVTATVAACFKIALGVYYLMAVARPANFVRFSP